jgi:hypothetical protein
MAVSLWSRSDRKTFFSSGERIQLVTYQIQNMPTLRRELLSFRSQLSFFPLHSPHGNEMLTEAVVYDIGSRCGLGGISRELEDHIVDYFGPTLGTRCPIRAFPIPRLWFAPRGACVLHGHSC